jgi:CheY-like chemotaxis protein
MVKDILIVDDDPVMLYTLAGLLKCQSNFFNIYPVVGTSKAIDILAGQEFHLLITGNRLPEMDAFNLALLMSSNMNLRIIMLTHDASSEFKDKIREMPSIVHFNHARDIRLLAQRMFSELQMDFGGQLRTTSLVSFLQMMELEDQSGTLLVMTKGRCGTIAVVDGKPFTARMGAMTGKDAMLEMLTWERISIDIDCTPPQVSSVINTNLMNLLLESGKIADDKRGQIVSLRAYERFDCRRLAEFRVDTWTFQCCLNDISEGGAYMETDQMVQEGQALTLCLYSPSLGRSCAIDGTVARRDAKGIGVRFAPLSPEQRQLVLSLVAPG